MKVLFFILIAFGLTSCGQYYNYSSYSNLNLPTDQKVIGKITLDNSYTLYVRSVYEGTNHKATPRENKSLITIMSMVEPATDKLIEIEYLLISESKKNVIYISTISDPYQNRYSNWPLPLNVINAYDFKVLLFGKINNEGEIVFQLRNNFISEVWGSQQDIWNYEQDASNSMLEIIGVTERNNNEFQLFIPVKEALKNPIIFTKQNSYSVNYRMFNEAEDKPLKLFLRRTGNPDVPLFTGEIYFRKSCGWLSGKKCNKMFMYFPFDKSLVSGRTLTNIYLKNKRIGSSPILLFD